jgi:hypothetical protein
MKKVRIFLSVLAIVFAVAGAVASQVVVPLEMGYEFIPASGIDEARCVAVDDICQESGSYACRVTLADPVLKKFVSSTTCGVELRRTTPPPAN